MEKRPSPFAHDLPGITLAIQELASIASSPELTHHPELRERVQARRAELEADRDALAAEIASSLSPAAVQHLERRVDVGEELTPDENEQWSAVVHDGLRQAQTYSAYKRWVSRPIVESLLAPRRPVVHAPRGECGRRVPRARRSSRSRSRSPGRSSSAGDGDSDHLEQIPLEAFWRDVDAWLRGAP